MQRPRRIHLLRSELSRLVTRSGYPVVNYLDDDAVDLDALLDALDRVDAQLAREAEPDPTAPEPPPTTSRPRADDRP